jgi:hypothetical protein
MPGVGWPWDAQTRRLWRLLSRPTPCRPTPTAITVALPFRVQLGVEGTMSVRLGHLSGKDHAAREKVCCKRKDFLKRLLARMRYVSRSCCRT